MQLELPPGATYTLDDIAWDEGVLRSMLQRMMERCHVGALDLVRAWDGCVRCHRVAARRCVVVVAGGMCVGCCVLPTPRLC